MKSLEIRCQSAELRKCSVLQKNSFWEAKNRKMKTLEIRHSKMQKSGNTACWEKKLVGGSKKKKKKFGNKKFKRPEHRKCNVLRKKNFSEAKKRKMKTLEIRHSRVQNSGNAAFCEKKSF